MRIAANEKIRTRRIELGLNDVITAQQAGLSKMNYFDIELHPDEIYTVTDLWQVKKLVDVLELDFLDLFDIQCTFCNGKEGFLNDYLLPRNEIIQKKRKSLNLSQEELGVRVGFYEIAIIEMEREPDFLESWSIELINDLANIIKVPLQILLHVKCSKCGR